MLWFRKSLPYILYLVDIIVLLILGTATKENRLDTHFLAKTGQRGLFQAFNEKFTGLNSQLVDIITNLRFVKSTETENKETLWSKM